MRPRVSKQKWAALQAFAVLEDLYTEHMRNHKEVIGCRLCGMYVNAMDDGVRAGLAQHQESSMPDRIVFEVRG